MKAKLEREAKRGPSPQVSPAISPRLDPPLFSPYAPYLRQVLEGYNQESNLSTDPSGELSSDSYYYSPKNKGKDFNPFSAMGWLGDACPGSRDSDEKETLRKVSVCPFPETVRWSPWSEMPLWNVGMPVQSAVESSDGKPNTVRGSQRVVHW